MDEAYPYVAQRLLTDDSPRLREALRYMVRCLPQRTTIRHNQLSDGRNRMSAKAAPLRSVG